MNFKQWLIAGMAAALAIYGCSPDAQYRTLSFFFDGVPLPGEETAQEASSARWEKSARKKSNKPRILPHGPYAAKMCDSCHRQGGGQLLVPVEELCFKCHDLDLSKRRVHGPVASGGCRVCHHPHGSGKAYNLVADATTFCFYCHDEGQVMSREAHQAAADTQCTECHDPHSSDYDYMLKIVN